MKCLCDVTLSVYPHRAGLKNMPGHGRNRTYRYILRYILWIYTPIDIYCGYILKSKITQASYSPEYITPTQQNIKNITKMKYCQLVAARRLTTGSILNNLKLEEYMFTSKTKISAKVSNLLCKRTTKWRNVFISCLFGDFNVYGGSPLSNNNGNWQTLTLLVIHPCMRNYEIIYL